MNSGRIPREHLADDAAHAPSNWPEVSRMQCRCPVCGGLTQVPSDLLNYLVRCDACGGLLRPIMAPQPNGRDVLKVEPTNVGRVREMVSINAGIAELLSPAPLPRRARTQPPPIPTQPPPLSNELPQVSLAEMAEMAAISGKSHRRPRRSRASLGIITASVIGAVALIATIIGVAATARPNSARADKVEPPARAQKSEPPGIAPAKVKPERAGNAASAVAKAETVRKLSENATEIPQPPLAADSVFTPADTFTSSTTGELFPGVH
jgi:hypothetical protein